jgi:hypothetical protein
MRNMNLKKYEVGDQLRNPILECFITYSLYLGIQFTA